MAADVSAVNADVGDWVGNGAALAVADGWKRRSGRALERARHTSG